MADASGYDPRRSRVSDDRMAEFQRGRLTGDLSEVPGIGPAAIKKLSSGEDEDKITNTFQLIGKFLMLKGPDGDGSDGEDGEDGKVDTVEHMERFWFFLQEKGISSHRSGIVRCIAEKVNGMMPGIYDASQYADDDDDDDDDSDKDE